MIKDVSCLRPFFLSTFFLAAFVSCYSLEVEEAFKGKFSSAKNNRLINDYCQSCHIHRDFTPEEHVLAKRKLYRKKLYKKAAKCRICHYIEPVWTREVLVRKTRYPREVQQGKYRKFEQKEANKRGK